MAALYEDLKTYLKTIAGVTSLVGSGTGAKIFSEIPKQGASLPYIVCQVFEGTSEEHIAGITGIARNRVQIDCYGTTPAAAHALSEAVRLAPLQMYRGTLGTTFANTISSRGGYRTGKDDPVKGGNTLRFWQSRDYFITYNEAKS